MFDRYLVVFKFFTDAFIFIVASAEENELIMTHILSALEESLSMLLRYVCTWCCWRGWGMAMEMGMVMVVATLQIPNRPVAPS